MDISNKNEILLINLKIIIKIKQITCNLFVLLFVYILNQIKY